MTYSAQLHPVVEDVLASSFGAAADAGALWRTVTDLGWHRIGIVESEGGVGGDLADLAELAAGVGRHAVALPLIETGLAAWTLTRVGRSADLLGDEPAVAVVLPALRGGALPAELRGIRFLPGATHVVLVLPDGRVGLLRRDELAVRESTDLADDPVGDLMLDELDPDVCRHGVDQVGTATEGLARELCERAALLRAAALGGAVDRAGRLVAEHVAVRTQFGRPLLAQQAVAHGVAAMACERDLIRYAVEAALAMPSPAAVAAARATAARCAGVAARTAHQLLGAMGITREHPLQLLTRRMWAWRDEDGTQRRWEQCVGEHVLTGLRDDTLWDLATGSALS